MNNWKDCKNCINCDSTQGFMCNCRYSYDTEEGHYQVGQYIRRDKAVTCEFYAEQNYGRDEFFIM